jgi:hypothetical protein
MVGVEDLASYGILRSPSVADPKCNGPNDAGAARDEEPDQAGLYCPRHCGGRAFRLASDWNAGTPPPAALPVAPERLMPTLSAPVVPEVEGQCGAEWAPVWLVGVRRRLCGDDGQGGHASEHRD